MKPLIKNTILILSLCYSTQLLSQDTEIENLLEFIINQEVGDEEGEVYDISQLRSELDNLQSFPININSNDIDKLVELGILNYTQKTAIQEYIKNYGKLIALEELAQIQELDRELIKSLKPFIQFEGIVKVQPVGIGRMAKESKYDLTLHYQQLTQKSKAYKEIEPIYIGSPARLMLKYSSKLYKRWRLGFNLEKDAGESFNFNLKQSRIGFDHNSAYLAYKGSGFLQTAIVGDFQCGFGQGLVFWRGFSFGKSSNSVPIRKVNSGIRPHTGLDEFNFLRGLAFEVGNKKYDLTAFISFRKLDANAVDSSYSSFSSLIQSGYHRSLSEIDNSGRINETLAAGHFNYNFSRFKVGLSFAYQALSANLIPKESLYALDYFSGNKNFLAGIDVDYKFNNGHVFAEFSRSANNAMSYLIGTVITPDPKLSISILNRGYSRNYQAISSNAFGEASRNQNERGSYIGLEYKASRKIIINAYYDTFHFPWIKSRVPTSSSGNEFLFKLTYKRSKKQITSIRYRFKEDELKIPLQNNSNLRRRHQLRLDFEQRLNPLFKMRYRLEFQSVNFMEAKKGYLFFVDFIFQSPEKPYSISARYALFNTDDYDTRIYAYERDVYFAYSITPYFYRGQKIYVNFKWRMRRFFTFVFRVSNINFPYRDAIGSGNDLIEGNNKTEVKFQLRIRW